MRYLRIRNSNKADGNFGKKYTFTSIKDYLDWDKNGFIEIFKEFGISNELSDLDFQNLATRVEFELPQNFYADSEKLTFKFAGKEPLSEFSDCDDFQAFYNFIIKIAIKMFNKEVKKILLKGC